MRGGGEREKGGGMGGKAGGGSKKSREAVGFCDWRDGEDMQNHCGSYKIPAMNSKVRTPRRGPVAVGVRVVGKQRQQPRTTLHNHNTFSVLFLQKTAPLALCRRFQIHAPRVVPW